MNCLLGIADLWEDSQGYVYSLGIDRVWKQDSGSKRAGRDIARIFGVNLATAGDFYYDSTGNLYVLSPKNSWLPVSKNSQSTPEDLKKETFFEKFDRLIQC